MVLAFTEEQAIEIRKSGLSVIQFKYCIKNGISVVTYTLRQFIIAFKSAIDRCKNLFKRVKDRLGYPTSRRYRFVKVLGNMGYRKYDVLVTTRTYLARSNC